MDYIKVTLTDLPTTIRGFTVYFFDENDGMVYYTIFINSKLNNDMQLLTYDHEIGHISNGDFASMVDVDKLELMRHIQQVG